MSYEDLLQSVMAIAKERHDQLHDLPITLGSVDSINLGLSSLPELLPRDGLGDTATMDLVRKYLLPALIPGQCGPRYFGFVTGGTLPSAQLGDFLTTIYDQNLGVNLSLDGIGPAIEARALRMIMQLLRLPEEVFNARTLTTGATASNVLGMACGRDFAVKHALGDPSYSVAEDGFGGATVKVFADRAHASLVKAASIVGIGKCNVVPIPFDTDKDALVILEAELAKFKRGEGKGAIVSLSFGEVNTGDFTSRVKSIRDLCDKYTAWLHIDAAFGAFARLVPSLQYLCEGLELADSITGDGHKWLNVPYDCGFFLSRSLAHQTSIFGPSSRSPPPAYLATSIPPGMEVSDELRMEISRPSPFTLGVENSRRFRALPLYCALLSLGEGGYKDLITRNISFARDIAKWMAEGEGQAFYEVLNLRSVPKLDSEAELEQTVPLNIVLFRASPRCPVLSFRPSNANGAAALAQAINSTTKMYVSLTDGAVRVAVSNWATGSGENTAGQGDLEIVIGVLKGIMEV